MLLLTGDKILKNGFCWGQQEPKIDDESRLHLPRKEVVSILNTHAVKKLYRCPDPTGERFILCPAQNWKTFVDAVRRHFMESMDSEQAWRMVCSGLPASIDGQGRIRITKICLDRANVGPGKRVSMLGVGLWYEISVYNTEKSDQKTLIANSKLHLNQPSAAKNCAGNPNNDLRAGCRSCENRQ
jgi:DNA-binding transcriptional regulator/RsmH inhibitor MraZ